MLGQLIAALDEPDVAGRLVAALDAPSLQERIALAADTSGRDATEVVAASVRGFLDTASDEEWLQLVGIMGRAADPGLAAMRAILERALPRTEERP